MAGLGSAPRSREDASHVDARGFPYPRPHPACTVYMHLSWDERI